MSMENIKLLILACISITCAWGLMLAAITYALKLIKNIKQRIERKRILKILRNYKTFNNN